jgi:hypothetical protein
MNQRAVFVGWRVVTWPRDPCARRPLWQMAKLPWLVWSWCEGAWNDRMCVKRQRRVSLTEMDVVTAPPCHQAILLAVMGPRLCQIVVISCVPAVALASTANSLSTVGRINSV